MENMLTLVMKYDPVDRTIVFRIRTRYGECVELDDSEPLKEYEYKPGIFSLEGLADKIFAFAAENFDGEDRAGIEIEVAPTSYEQRQVEFERFEEAVEKFNRNHELQLLLTILKTAEEKKEEAELPHESADHEPELKESVRHRKIAVAGLTGSGKTSLIEGITAYCGSECEIEPYSSGITKYLDVKNGVEWYETGGFEIGERVAMRMLDLHQRLIQEGINMVIYCVNAASQRFWDQEKIFITNLKKQYPDIQIFVVLTFCFDMHVSKAMADAVYSSTEYTETFMILAKQMRTRAGCIEAFGLEQLAEKIYGG